jgi:arginase
MAKQLQILINQSEITAGTRGASLGPEAIMTAARKKESTFFSENPPRFLPNFNAALDAPVKHPFAKRIEFLDMLMDEIIDALDYSYGNNEFPFLVSGDHGSAAGTLAGIKKRFPNQRLGVVWIDAHGDLHNPYTTPTGNMHGMPLAIAAQEDNMDCKTNDIQGFEIELWKNLKNKGTNSPKFNYEDLLFLGVRDTEKQEDFLIEKHNIKNVKVEAWRELNEGQRKACLDELTSKVDILYVSFDVDSMDPDLTSYGTGTPVKNGFSPAEAEWMLGYFASQKKLICMEFVEVNPCLDNKCNKMAEVTFELLNKTVEKLKKNL